jgi:hypothetical protein
LKQAVGEIAVHIFMTTEFNIGIDPWKITLLENKDNQGLISK